MCKKNNIFGSNKIFIQMKKKYNILGILIFPIFFHAQVGINNTAPQATLDITAKTTDGSKAEGFIAPRLTGDQIKAADTQYNLAQKGTVVYATAAVTASSIKTSNITIEGYYYFDGVVWQRIINANTDNSIYNGDGSLIANRNVIMGDKNLSFTSVTGNLNFNTTGSGKVGIGTNTPTELLDVSGKTRTTRFQMTDGATNGYILISDASGNGTWQNLQDVSVKKTSFSPPSGSTTNYTIPCAANFDIIELKNSNTNFAANIFLPSPACSTPGQKVRISSTSNTSATISKNNTTNYATTMILNGDVYEYTFTNGRWELTLYPTKSSGFCSAPNNSATTLVNPTAPKTIFYFYDACWSSPITLPSGGSLGDLLIIDDTATFNVTINTANTTMASSFVLSTGSYVQFIKTYLGWTKQF